MRNLVSRTIGGLTPYPKARSRPFGPRPPIRLCQNENPFGPSPRALEALRAAQGDVHRYPDDAAGELVDAIAERHGVDPPQIAITGGITELIEVTVRTFVTPGEHAIVSAGSFVAYRLLLEAAGIPFSAVPLRPDRALDLDGLAASVRPETKVLFLPNPNNPTGSRFTAGELERFLGTLPDDVVLFLDDAYLEYVDARDHPDSVAVLRRRPRTIVARTFSKVHGLAGLRVGYGISHPELARHLQRVRRPFAVNRPALAAALGAFGDEDHVRRSVARTHAGLAKLTAGLRGLGLKVLPSHANFVTLDLGTEAEAEQLSSALADRAILVRRLAPFGLPDHVRVTVGTEEENRALVTVLGDLLG